MKGRKFSEALGAVDDKLIDEAIHYSPDKKYKRIGWIAMAVCLFFIVGKFAIDGIEMGTNMPTQTITRNKMELRTDGALLYYINLEDENQWYSYNLETKEQKKEVDFEESHFEKKYVIVKIKDDVLYYEEYEIPIQKENTHLVSHKAVVVGERLCVVFYDGKGQWEDVEIHVYSLQ